MNPDPDPAAIDLSLSFGPAWAKGEDASSERLAKLAAKHDCEDRPDRGGKHRGQREDRGPRSGDRRPPRRDGGGGGRDRDKRGGGRRDGRREEREREPRAPQPLKGWEAHFVPDKHGVDGLAKQIKSTAKAYPLFDLAQLVLEKSERYLVEFKRVAEDAPALFKLTTDGSVWTSEREAVAHALAAQLDKFYRRERIAVDPPKGNFTSVAVCGMSGTLLGPSNYHDYQTKLIRLHAERFATMPFEAFKSRIRMVRDEESIAKWKEEQSAKDVFYPIDPNAETKPAEETTKPANTVTEPVAEEPAGTAVSDVPSVTEPATEDATVAKETVAEPASEEPVESESMEGEPAETQESPAAEAAESEPSEKFHSLAEVEAHFRAHHAAKVVVPIRQRVLVPGSPAMNSSSVAVHMLARGVWEQLRRFPLPLAHVLGQQLAARGVQIFKAHENVTYVSLARPKFLDRTATPLSDGLSGMLAYIEEHPGVPRAEQWKALIALRPVPVEGAEDRREMDVAADLSWLLHEGHVIDFAKRGLEAARRPKPPKDGGKAPKAAAVVEETLIEDTPVEDVAEADDSLSGGENDV